MTNILLPYRPNVCLMVCNAQGQFLLGQRHGSKGSWQLPQGGVDMDESLEEAALREAHEELGVDYQHLELLLKLSCVHQYDFDKPRYYGSTQFRGQEQEFALIYLHADDSAIQLARYEQELDKTCWCTSEEIIRKAEQRRTIGYKKAFLELSERGMLEKGRVKPDYLSATCK